MIKNYDPKIWCLNCSCWHTPVERSNCKRAANWTKYYSEYEYDKHGREQYDSGWDKGYDEAKMEYSE